MLCKHSYLPGTGVRSILNKLGPQLKDVENNFLGYFANRNKFLGPVNANLVDEIDVFTGEPIQAWHPVTAAINSVLPVFKTNGKMEEWREILLQSGWSGLQDVRRNPVTGDPMTPEERKMINTWIGKNYNLGARAKELVMQDESYWKKEIAKYKKERGLQKQTEFPIKATLLHREMDALMNEAYRTAWRSIGAQNAAMVEKGQLRDAVSDAIKAGDLKSANQFSSRVRQINPTN